MSSLLIDIPERPDSTAPGTPPARTDSPAESPAARVVGCLLILAIAGLLLMGLLRVWYPAHPGVDQNGYLVGGKLLAQTGSPGWAPPDPYCFVGAMWNLGPDGQTYYPKYPLGLPAVYAFLILVFGANWGTWLSHLVSPVATVLAVVGVYALARPYLRVFGAILTAVVIAVSPVTVSLATNPNSHAATLASAVWGMVALLSWWRNGGYVRSAAAGALLGFALTIRYTEGLLLLPMLLVALDRSINAPSRRAALGQALAMTVSWATPVALLLGFNLVHFGVLTGYDTTRESTGFGWAYFVANWDLMLRELDDKALTLLFGLGIAGMGMMVAMRREWKLGVVLSAWAMPCVFAYSAYYWAPETTGIGYARFVLTVLPAFAMAAVWTLTIAVERVTGPSGGAVAEPGPWSQRMWGDRPHRVATVVAGVVVGLASANLASLSSESAVAENRGSFIVKLAADHLLEHAPPGSMVYSEARVLHHLQFVGEYGLYSPDVFSRSSVLRLGDVARTDDPHPLQPQRAKALYERLKDLTEAQLIAEQNRLMDGALGSGRRVYFVGPLNVVRDLRRRFAPEARYATDVRAQWQEPGDFRRSRWQRTGNDPPPWANRRPDLRPAETRGVLWQVVEITARPASTRPGVSARLTTQPAVNRRPRGPDARASTGRVTPEPSTLPTTGPHSK